ncbi:SPOR domain-containing protein [Salinibacter ruber]|uniref:SPOR domain-containing protein n=1 Tax=Salinibacter ruber TaxID=146919 RepID=UPI002168F5D5|nr:SPOR domain-containing protein [Salinibacter ruber]MCS3641886.1 Tfp pilus assembly protein PilN [Salinibacter ruber]
MSAHALGIMVSADALHAVLLERTDEETSVQFRWSSGSSDARGGDLPFEEPGDMTPDVEEESDDVTIQFGDGGGGGSDDMFMGSEFDDIDGGSEALGGDEGGEAWNFQVELDNLLDECAERGYEDPEIAFCSSTSQIDDVELRLPPDETDAEEAEETEHGLPLPASRSTLLDMLEEQYEGEADGERVGFVPMHRTGDGYQRVLALIARPGGPVLSTLDSMQDQTLSRAPQTRLLDAEVSLYLGLARSVLQLPPGTPEKTIFVRSSTDDTLVLFIEGNTLRQSEHLPELTAEDSAETICSRVLLLQDEYGMGQVQHLMLVAEEDEEVLASAFKSYFSTAELHVLRSHLPGGDDTDAEAYVGATGAALRLLDDDAFAPHFQPVNLLAKKYVPSRLRLPVGWPVPAMLTLLAIATLGFVWLYFVNASTISEKRTALRALEQKVNQVDQEALQRRIDSMKAMTTEYAAANKTIGGLLQGSNKWSSGLATVTGQMNDLRGLTINQWSPQSGTEVTILGRSNDRSKVVELAQRLDGRILGLTFTETRDVSLYDFELTVPLDTTKPEAIEYWREQRGEQLAAGTEAVDVGPDAPAPDSSTTTGPSTTAQASPGTGAPAAPPEAESTGDAQARRDTLDASSVWTVVVASVLESAAAEETARRFRERLDGGSHPVQVRHSPENGRYRVGIGRFVSVQNALAMLQDMSGTLPEGAWLLKMTGEDADPASAGAAASTSSDQPDAERSV